MNQAVMGWFTNPVKCRLFLEIHSAGHSRAKRGAAGAISRQYRGGGRTLHSFGGMILPPYPGRDPEANS